MMIPKEIDHALAQLGSALPPPDLQQRIERELRYTVRRPTPSLLYGIAGGALAAGVALSTVALNPTLRHLVFPSHPTVLGTAHPAAASHGSFGAAKSMHVPLEPIPVQPTPVNQHTGRARTGRATLSSPLSSPLPRGVMPTQPPVAASGR